ncbi:MAG TPA: class E sortase [Propionibacteriaceae bacterium]
MFALLIPLAAVAPWLVPWPWQQADQEPTSDPSSIIVLAHSKAVTGRESDRRQLPPPSEASLRAISKDVAATATSGYDTPVSAATAAKVKTTPGPYSKLGRVAIPRTGLNVAFGEGVSAKTLDKGPGHWPGTPMPGQLGNAVLSGHRNTHTAPFKDLHLLRRGDKVVVTRKGHKPVAFRVKDTTIVREAKYKDFVLRQPKDPDAKSVTLFACHPAGHPIYRIVVRAHA